MLMGFYMEGLLLGVNTLYRLFCFFKQFLIGCIGLTVRCISQVYQTGLTDNKPVLTTSLSIVKPPQFNCQVYQFTDSEPVLATEWSIMKQSPPQFNSRLYLTGLYRQ